MTTFKLTSFASLLALLVAAPACSALSDDTASADDDYKVKPTDGETLARLVVDAPSGWTLPVNQADDVTVAYRNATFPVGASQRLQEGDGNLTVTSKFDVAVNGGNIKLVKGATATYKLGQLEPKYDATKLTRDFGPTPALSVYYKGPSLDETQVYGQRRAQPAFWNGAPARALLAPAGDYRFSWSVPILADITKTLAEGAHPTINLTPADKRATIIVKKPTARELPDVPTSSCHLPARTFLVHRRAENTNGQWGEPPSYDQRNTSQVSAALQNGYNSYGTSYDQIQSWAALPMQSDTTVKVFPFASSEGGNHYELVVNNVAMPLALQPGDTKTIQLERLDVDDVEITKEDGSKYTVHGSWQLYRQGPNATWLPITIRQDCSNAQGQAVSFPTNAGLDVLPGTYRLVISYTTGEGPKTQDQVVTVP